jgi:hypothetical protein
VASHLNDSVATSIIFLSFWHEGWSPDSTPSYHYQIVTWFACLEYLCKMNLAILVICRQQYILSSCQLMLWPYDLYFLSSLNLSTGQCSIPIITKFNHKTKLLKSCHPNPIAKFLKFIIIAGHFQIINLNSSKMF